MIVPLVNSRERKDTSLPTGLLARFVGILLVKLEYVRFLARNFLKWKEILDGTGKNW